MSRKTIAVTTNAARRNKLFNAPAPVIRAKRGESLSMYSPSNQADSLHKLVGMDTAGFQYRRSSKCLIHRAKNNENKVLTAIKYRESHITRRKHRRLREHDLFREWFRRYVTPVP